MTLLFSPLTLGKLKLVNRLCVPPMCQYRAKDGVLQAWHRVHYGKLAGSGAGLVVVEATAVTPEGRITPACLGLWNDEQTEAFKALTSECRAVSPETKLMIQLSHSGRKGSRTVPWEESRFLTLQEGGFAIEAPSAVTCGEPESLPREMTEDDIHRVIDAFAAAAKRAQAAGFDGIQIHAAHGYLIHEFLSPVTNRRTDGWGGSLENRMRFGLAVIKAVREAVPDMALAVRVSATDWIEGGWTVEDTVAFLKAARVLGCDAADVSAGGLDKAQQMPELKPGYQVEYARVVKKETGLVTFAVGLIKEPRQAEAILAAGDADGICVGREMLRNPNWGWTAAQALHAMVAFPPPYLRAF